MENQTIIGNYSSGRLLDAIRQGIATLGKTVDTVTADDLAPVEEFHIGGRQATGDLLSQMSLGPQDQVLDVGCGIGGTSRFIAASYGARVTGIDLTPEFVETGTEINTWLGMQDLVALNVANALETGLPDSSYDAACMLHVGMNIPDKAALMAEVSRVLRPDGRFAIYDVMLTGDGARVYPVPWALGPEGCAIASLSVYRDALEAAGFTISSVRDRTDFAAMFFAKMRKSVQSSSGPPPIGLHLISGEQAPVKVANMITNIASGYMAPVEIIARKA